MPKYVGLGISPNRKEALGDETGAIIVNEGGLGLLAHEAHNDLDIDETGNLRLAYDAEAIGEHARQRLQFFKGEWFLDATVGVPWFEQVLGYAESRLPIAEATVKRVLLQTPGVTGLREVASEVERRARGVKITRAEVETEFDESVVV